MRILILITVFKFSLQFAIPDVDYSWSPWKFLNDRNSKTPDAVGKFDLVHLEPNRDTKDIKSCQDKNDKSCTVIKINKSGLKEGKVSLPGCKDMVMKTKITPSFENPMMFLASQLTEYVNEKEGCSATFASKDNELMANIEVNGTNFVIEPCKSFEGCHVWKEQNEKRFKENGKTIFSKNKPVYSKDVRKDFRSMGSQDTRTFVTYTVKFYYTQEFQEIIDDIIMFFDMIVGETNQGYRDSGIPVMMKIHCIEEIDRRYFRQQYDSQENLENFRRYKRTAWDIKGSADIAVVLVTNMEDCGMAYTDAWRDGYTLAVVDKTCATGYFSLGHEIAHSFGCMHDKKHEFVRGRYQYAHGAYIGYGPFRTIMAYKDNGYEQRVDVYSSPNIRYQGAFTGHLPYENCARVITENRFAIARLGDESIQCSSPLWHNNNLGLRYADAKNSK